MEINLAVKSAQIEKQLSKILKIAEKYEINSIEVQELISLMEKTKTEYRAEIVNRFASEYGIERIAYHFPIKNRWDSVSEAKEYDLAWESKKIIYLSQETIREAAIVANKSDITTIIPIDFHLFRFVGQEEISLKEKMTGLLKGEKSLIKLKEFSERICEEYNLKKNGECLIKITRENNPPEHGIVAGLIDFHPLEINRTYSFDIYTCLDFAHLQQYLNYLRNNNDEFKWLKFDKTIYQPLNWKEAIEILTESLLLVHLNDAKGYRKEDEGLEIGTGEMDFYYILRLIKQITGPKFKEIIFTIEIKDGHINFEKVDRSISKILTIFDTL